MSTTENPTTNAAKTASLISIPTTSAPSSGTSTPRASKKPRCAFKECRIIAQPIVGDCSFCSKHYCGKHRMLESHNCSGLEDCKKAERERIRDKLEGERTVAIRGI